MGLFDDIIKSAVKDTVAELLKEEIQAAQGAGNGDGENAPGAGNGETGDEKGAGGAADESPENASGTGEPETADVKAVVKKMLEGAFHLVCFWNQSSIKDVSICLTCAP